MAEPGGKTLGAETFLGVYLGFWPHPAERPGWVKKASSQSRGTAVLLQNPKAAVTETEGHGRCLCVPCDCLKGCSLTFKLSSPSMYKVIGVRDRNLSALPSQKILGCPFRLMVLNYS